MWLTLVACARARAHAQVPDTLQDGEWLLPDRSFAIGQVRSFFEITFADGSAPYRVARVNLLHPALDGDREPNRLHPPRVTVHHSFPTVVPCNWLLAESVLLVPVSGRPRIYAACGVGIVPITWFDLTFVFTALAL